MRETQVLSLGQGDILEKGMATHSSILAWRIPWTEKPGSLQSRGSQRIVHEWATNNFTFIWEDQRMDWPIRLILKAIRKYKESCLVKSWYSCLSGFHYRTTVIPKFLVPLHEMALHSWLPESEYSTSVNTKDWLHVYIKNNWYYRMENSWNWSRLEKLSCTK